MSGEYCDHCHRTVPVQLITWRDALYGRLLRARLCERCDIEAVRIDIAKEVERHGYDHRA